MFFFGPAFHADIAAASEPQADFKGRHKLKFVRSSSAPLPLPTPAAIKQNLGGVMEEGYGLTETCLHATANLPDIDKRKPGTDGLPAGPEVRVVDPQGHYMPAGQAGEVVIKGENVTSGYENNAAANRKNFKQGWFHTGDVGSFDNDGYLTLHGRIKEMISRGGEKYAAESRPGLASPFQSEESHLHCSAVSDIG